MEQTLQRALLFSSGIIAGVALTIGSNRFYKSMDDIKNIQRQSGATRLKTALYTNGDPVLGRDDAPLTIIVFSDYECPYCKRFHDEVLPELKNEYIQKGIVRLIHKDLPLPFHINADLSARVARCSAENQEYWMIYSELFKGQDCLSCLGPTKIVEKFNTGRESTLKKCINSKKTSLAISSNISEARLNGIKGTPTFIIGKTQKNRQEGKVIEGAIPWSDFKKEVESALLKARLSKR